ncbi:MAG: hypothetical protein ACJAXH_002637, partial [Colwellia sp.]
KLFHMGACRNHQIRQSTSKINNQGMLIIS